MWQVRWFLFFPTQDLLSSAIIRKTNSSLLIRCADVERNTITLRQGALAAVRVEGDGEGVVGLAEGGLDAPVEGMSARGAFRNGDER